MGDCNQSEVSIEYRGQVTNQSSVFRPRLTWRTARPGRLWCTQAVALQSAGEAAPSVSVVVLGGHDQHEVCSQSQISIER